MDYQGAYDKNMKEATKTKYFCHFEFIETKIHKRKNAMHIQKPKKKCKTKETQHALGYAKVCKTTNPMHVIDSPNIR
jgi:hypothetical protein